MEASEEPLLSRKTGIQVEPARSRRKRSKNKNVDRGGLLSRFSKWDQYKRTSSISPPIGRDEPLSRRASVRRTDFTNRKEYDRYQRQKRFIFHRGFFRRNANSGRGDGSIRSGSDNRIRLKNRAELNAALQYVDLQSLEPQDVIRTGQVTTFVPTQLRQRTPAVVISSVAPVDEYTRSLGRTLSIKRSMPIHISPPMNNNGGPKTPTRPSSSLHRSLSTPASLRNIWRRSSIHSPQRKALQNIWREYLLLVITQRLQLRISLLSDGNGDDDGGDSIVPSIGQASETKESLHSGRIPSAVDDSPSASLVTARRKVL